MNGRRAVGGTRLVVVGQGYVGLPLAMRAVESGYWVAGFDTDGDRVKRLTARGTDAVPHRGFTTSGNGTSSFRTPSSASGSDEKVGGAGSPTAATKSCTFSLCRLPPPMRRQG
jgi:hypothetical protein